MFIIWYFFSPDLSTLSNIVKNNVVKKDVCNAKIKDIKNKKTHGYNYITTMDALRKIDNKFTNNILDANIKEKKLVNESDI